MKNDLIRHRETNRLWYLKNKERILALRKLYNPRRNELLKKRRHEQGISKKYSSGIRLASNPEIKKMHRKKNKAMRRMAGTLSINIVQLVYEDNIKKYGTLTCYLCLLSIEFGKDELEHKIPLSRGGTHDYNNLEIACGKCNRKKYNKTLNEFIVLKG